MGENAARQNLSKTTALRRRMSVLRIVIYAGVLYNGRIRTGEKPVPWRDRYAKRDRFFGLGSCL